MIDINRHRFLLVQILKEVYSDLQLANILGFKGGTALMFFHDLPRFSVDLDFNLLDAEAEQECHRKMKSILLQHGRIHDEALKFHRSILVLDYGAHERKLKVEISTRRYPDRYEVRNLLGIDVKVMRKEDMFAHKLCALIDRDSLANRDVFDCWHFMKEQTPVNIEIIESRMDLKLEEILDKCISRISTPMKRGLLDGLGDLLDPSMKQKVKTSLLDETIHLMKFYKNYPILSKE